MFSTQLLSCILIFCRVAIGLVFVVSFGSKIVNVSAFRDTITSFRLLPAALSVIIAWLILGGELTVVICLAFGSWLLFPGFGLAFALLLLFSVAMTMVLLRGIHTSCNCFGASKNPVTLSDIWRNAGFIGCTLLGSAILLLRPVSAGSSTSEWLLSGVSAGIFVLIWLQLGQIIQLFRAN
ncbi:hypothetical protein EPA93_01915 [Ktedonosporobacter rubrisoli]|uniref:Methylamine utilisation protein MauE domain-containing protein n=1 Tax=Ktedonosporobacter rubrisoli TaxID=2509675 RepID=A0A4P6JIC9_KTERU|nr:MauE/DoxX family redox-associated membrane protein [Ktedonosporobacter rubrisoli]QBD74815.1 hypothetical protein EPA93_01915 [Ktedonosporobacter rubrisoli]